MGPYAIELKEDSIPFTSTTYPLSKDEQQELDGFISENPKNGGIITSSPPPSWDPYRPQKPWIFYVRVTVGIQDEDSSLNK